MNADPANPANLIDTIRSHPRIHDSLVAYAARSFCSPVEVAVSCHARRPDSVANAIADHYFVDIHETEDHTQAETARLECEAAIAVARWIAARTGEAW